jgi:hypothetical protein
MISHYKSKLVRILQPTISQSTTTLLPSTDPAGASFDLVEVQTKHTNNAMWLAGLILSGGAAP